MLRLASRYYRVPYTQVCEITWMHVRPVHVFVCHNMQTDVSLVLWVGHLSHAPSPMRCIRTGRFELARWQVDRYNVRPTICSPCRSAGGSASGDQDKRSIWRAGAQTDDGQAGCSGGGGGGYTVVSLRKYLGKNLLNNWINAELNTERGRRRQVTAPLLNSTDLFQDRRFNY